MVFEEKTIGSENIFNGRIINVKLEKVLMPDGSLAQREIVKHPGGVGIVALTDDDKVVLVKQFRKPLNKAIYEIPAGKLDKNEEVEMCGRRELLEETGASAKKFTSLGYMYPSPGFTDEVTHIYLATGLSFGNASPDEDEFLDVELFTIDEIKEMIMKNEINDGKTVMGFFKMLEMRNGGI